MKKLLILCFTLFLLGSFTACGSQEDASPEDSSRETDRYVKEELTAEELEKLLADQPVSVTSASLLPGEDGLKALYPDILSCILQNNSDADIKNVTVAFTAWDANRLPVLIQGQYDPGDGSYVAESDYEAINLVPGGTFGKDYGLPLADEPHNIATCKAIVVSYETFEGDTWSNPYYDDFKTLYEGQKLK